MVDLMVLSIASLPAATRRRHPLPCALLATMLLLSMSLHRGRKVLQIASDRGHMRTALSREFCDNSKIALRRCQPQP